jgi:sulfoxide reductase heme-binding subunit YedZ
MTRDQRYRFLYKPLVHLACLVPFLWALSGVLAASGIALPSAVPVPELGADPVRRVLGIVGKSTLNLLLITLAVTPLRQLTGNAQLLRFRRMLGLYAFFYACSHFLVYLGPYQSFSWPEISKDIVKRPYITLGFTALLMLVPLAVTSTSGMMRRLKKRWTTIHRMIYVIATLGVWHYWWQVKKDIREPLVYAAILAVLLGWRVWKRGAARRRPESPAGPAAGGPTPRAATSTSAPPTVPERT